MRIATGLAAMGGALSVMTAAASVKRDAQNASADEMTASRTGHAAITIPVRENSVHAKRLARLGGLVVYDPAFDNTAAVRSAVSFIDGDAGVLEYRGYAIEELAEHASFLEVAHLLVHGELPASASAAAEWERSVAANMHVPGGVASVSSGLERDAHPMGVFIASMAALGTTDMASQPAVQGASLFVPAEGGRPDASLVPIARILGAAPLLAANAFRLRAGRPPLTHADMAGGYARAFLRMLDDREPAPVLAHALDVLFVLHAEHEMNCSTAAMRHVASSRADPYSSVAAAAAALHGPLHGGANEAVLRMLADEVKTVDGVGPFLERVKRREARLMGFGHRVYRNYDPRARIVKRLAEEVALVRGEDPLVAVAFALERAALADAYFAERKLYPNVDFYSGVIYRAMGFHTDFFPVLFALPRVAGWLAHWREALVAGLDGAPRIWRPRQVYVGPSRRPYVPVDRRALSAESRSTESSEAQPPKARL